MLEKIPNPLGFSESLGASGRAHGRAGRGPQRPPGRPGRTTGDRLLVLQDAAPDALGGLLEAEEQPGATGMPLEPLVREWLSDLGIQGRSEQTIQWYRHKMTGYLRTGGASTLGQLTGAELKRYLAELQRRGLSADTIHGCFATIRAFAGWASRENYEVDPSLFR